MLCMYACIHERVATVCMLASYTYITSYTFLDSVLVTTYISIYRSNILQHFISFTLWYYIYDTYAMCDACNLGINHGITSLPVKCRRVLSKNFVFMIHHFLMFLSFPIGFVSIHCNLHTYTCWYSYRNLWLYAYLQTPHLLQYCTSKCYVFVYFVDLHD